MFKNNYRKEFFIFLIIAIVVSFAFSGKTIAATPLEGAWLLTEFQDADGNVDSEPLRGLIMFTSTHYSVMYTVGDKPRALMPDGVENRTDAQIVEGYNSLIANSGR